MSAELRPRREDPRREHSKQQGSRSSGLSRDERAHGRCRAGEERGVGTEAGGGRRGFLIVRAVVLHLQGFCLESQLRKCFGTWWVEDRDAQDTELPAPKRR